MADTRSAITLHWLLASGHRAMRKHLGAFWGCQPNMGGGPLLLADRRGLSRSCGPGAEWCPELVSGPIQQHDVRSKQVRAFRHDTRPPAQSGL